MLRLTTQQMDAFVSAQIERFMAEVVEHLKRSFPGRYQAVGRTAVMEFVACMIETASRYSIREKRDIARMIDVFFILGRDCDCDPNLPWVREILTQDLRAATRVDELCNSAIGYLRVSAAQPTGML